MEKSQSPIPRRGISFLPRKPSPPPAGAPPPGGEARGRWGPLSPSLAPPAGELSAQLTERAGDGLPRRGFSPILPNSTKHDIISSAHGYALALPVFGRREAPSSGGGRTSFIKPPLSRGGGGTYGDSFGTDPDRSAHRERSDSVRPYLQQ